MTTFRFQGEIPASKSMFNRALLIQSFFPQLQIQGDSNCDDVVHMKAAVRAFAEGRTLDCGEAGTTFRFLAARVSRTPGEFFLQGTQRLLQRPQAELAVILEQLGVEATLEANGVRIRGQGWRKPTGALRVPRSRSSQFASAVLLSSWELPFDLEIEFEGDPISEGYLQMSRLMVEELGLRIDAQPSSSTSGSRLKIGKGQTLQKKSIRVEPDYSSMFSVVAAALVAGEVEIPSVGTRSLQPDFVFIEHLRSMGSNLRVEDDLLRASKAAQLRPVHVSLRECPDLFPVLAALCSYASGPSHLFAAPQLAHKESDRLRKTQELLGFAGIDSQIESEGLRIQGQGPNFQPKAFAFSPDQDHRMAMAAALFQLRESRIQIASKEVVSKSFPDFWRVVGLA